MLTASHPHCVSLNRAATARRSTFQKSQTRRAALIAIPRRILTSCPTEGTQAADKGPSASLARLRHPSTYREYASGCRGARRLASGPFSTACLSSDPYVCALRLRELFLRFLEIPRSGQQVERRQREGLGAGDHPDASQRRLRPLGELARMPRNAVGRDADVGMDGGN